MAAPYRWRIFKRADGEPGINDWKIITLEPKKESDPDEAEEAMEEVLAGMETMMAEIIKPSKPDGSAQYGAFSTLDEDADGYYVVKWKSEPYTLQEDEELKEYTPAIVLKAGALVCDAEDADGYYVVKWKSEPYTLQEDEELKEYTPAIVLKAGALVCDAEYYNKVPGASLWYTPMQGEQRKTKVRVKQVVAADLKVAPISEENKLPAGMSVKNKKDAAKKGAVRVDKDEHEMVLDEIHRREVLEHDEELGDDDASDVSHESDQESSEDENEGEGEGE